MVDAKAEDGRFLLSMSHGLPLPTRTMMDIYILPMSARRVSVERCLCADPSIDEMGRGCHWSLMS